MISELRHYHYANVITATQYSFVVSLIRVKLRFSVFIFFSFWLLLSVCLRLFFLFSFSEILLPLFLLPSLSLTLFSSPSLFFLPSNYVSLSACSTPSLPLTSAFRFLLPSAFFTLFSYFPIHLSPSLPFFSSCLYPSLPTPSHPLRFLSLSPCIRLPLVLLFYPSPSPPYLLSSIPFAPSLSLSLYPSPSRPSLLYPLLHFLQYHIFFFLSRRTRDFAIYFRGTS